MLKFFCKITGDDYNLLKNETPESKKKVAALAVAVFIPVFIWVSIGFLLTTQIMGMSTNIGLLVAFSLGMLVFMLERTIIMANGSRLVNTFRIVLGLVIALLGAIFLDEVIFHKDIELQLAQMRRTHVEESVSRIDNEYASQLLLSQERVSKHYQDWQDALEEARREADGTGGSGQRGVDGIARLKLDAAAQLKNEYDRVSAAHGELVQRIEQLRDDARQHAGAEHYDGLLLRVKALFTLVFTDWVMAFVYIMFTLFLFSLEFLVVLLKIGWKKTNYERKMEMIEEIGKRRMEMLIISDVNHFHPAMYQPALKNIRKKLQDTKQASLFG